MRYISATIGMGYGTTMAPVLLLTGFSPLQVVPAILLSQFISGLLAAGLHHGAGNVHFDFNNDPEHRIVRRLGKLGYIPKSNDARVALVLGICSTAGVLAAVIVAVHIPVFYLKLYIGLIVLAMGTIVMVQHNTVKDFSWKRITGIGILASFNKGISGGGYGPLITSGQILSGVHTRNSVGITSLAEGVTCCTGVLAYFFMGIHIDWSLAPYLMAGSLMAIPMSVYTLKRMPLKKSTLTIGVATTLLGTLILGKLII